jgi:uncharacterized damage-inducible protein DinB
MNMGHSTKRLANQIERTVTGPMWHGPSLNDVLAGVSAADARKRPIAGAHTIWEIVLHVAVWAEVPRARLQGERMADLPPEEDWPQPGDDWNAALARMREAYRALADDVRNLDDERLPSKVGNLEYTVGTLLHGVVEHGTYHAGQIALLKRASHL